MTNEETFIASIRATNSDYINDLKENINTFNCGSKLLVIRELEDLTRIELSKLMGYSESTISRIERDIDTPTTKFMNVLLAFGVIGAIKNNIKFEFNGINISLGIFSIYTMNTESVIKIPISFGLIGIGFIKGLERICKINDLKQVAIGDHIQITKLS